MAKLKTLDTLSRRLKSILAESFPGASLRIERRGPLKKYGGIIVWQGFEGMEQIDRQRQLWSRLRSALSAEDQLRITAILTMTPAER